MQKKPYFQNILLGTSASGLASDAVRKLAMANITLAMGAAILLPYAIVNYLAGRHLIALLNIVVTLIVIPSLVYQRRHPESLGGAGVGVSALVTYLFFLLVSDAQPLYGYLWTFTLPSLLLFLMGLRNGSILFATLYVFVVVTFSGLIPEIGPRYPDPFLTRYLIALVFTFLLALYAEYSRERTFALLERRNRSLAATVANARTLTEDLRESEILYRTLIERANDGIVLLSGNKIQIANESMAKMLGYSTNEMIGQSYQRFVVPEERERLASYYGSRIRRSPSPDLYETSLMHREGYHVPAEINAGLVHFRHKLVDFVVVRDISVRKKYEDELRFLAYHDSLTGLPNRKALYELLEAIGSRRSTDSGLQHALLYLDLNGFKRINDQFGHDAGDHVLYEVAARLRRALRTADSVFRIGGDEFVAVAQSLVTTEDAAAVAGKLVSSLESSIEWQGCRCSITTSIGICLFTTVNVDIEAILRQADNAMFAAKQGGAAYRFAEPY